MEIESQASRATSLRIEQKAAGSRLKRQEKVLYPLGLLFLMVSRLGLQWLLYQAGFLALTADDYGRIVLAARWAQRPFLLWRGAWLPFHMYLFGTALKIKWDLLTGPRLIAIFIGEMSIVLAYLLAVALFHRRSAGLLAAIFLAFNPAHVWLSSAPLSEIPATALILGCFLCFVLFLKNGRLLFLFLSAGLLAIANGFRYEAWMLSAVFSLYLAGFIAFRFYREQIRLRESIPFWIAACLPWLFPIAWLIGNKVLTGNPFYFLGEITSYKLSHYGTGRSYWSYVQTLVGLDPAGFILVFAGFGLLVKKLRSDLAGSWYLLMIWAPFLVFAYLHGGQSEPPGNSIRYLAPFFFIAYPAAGIAADSFMRRLGKNWIWGTGLILLVFAGILSFQIKNTFQFVNDPASDGLAVGQALQNLRVKNAGSRPQPALIEVSYWGYLAIHIGSNDIDHIFYDRPVDYSANPPSSLLLADPTGLNPCITRYDIAYIIMKSPDLIQIIEDQLHLSPLETVNGYAIFQVPDDFPEEAGAACSLEFSKAETRAQDGR